MNDAGLPLESTTACVASRAVASSMRSRFVNLSFHRYGERVGRESGVNSSGKVRRFSFWAMQVRRLAFARLRRVRRCSFFFAAHRALQLRQQVAEGKINGKIAIVAHQKVAHLVLETLELSVEFHLGHLTAAR